MLDAGVCEKQSFQASLPPYNPEAETALRLLIWYSERLIFSHLLFSGGVLFAQTPVSMQLWLHHSTHTVSQVMFMSHRIVLYHIMLR